MAFVPDYQQACRAFRAAAQDAGGRTSVIAHPAAGPRGESLAVDVARFGSDDPSTAVFLISGVHGVELAVGTECQVDLMRSGRLSALDGSSAVVLIHAANPWGAAFSRRYTEENVDLCRNFRDFPAAASVPEGYDAIRDAVDVVPADETSRREADRTLNEFALTHGVAAFYNAVMAGQYRDPRGIGFGGHEATWARLTLERIMLAAAGDAERIVTLDYHTGVGPYAYGCVVAMQTGARLKNAERYFGPWIMAPRESPPPGFIDVTGHSGDGYEALFPERDVVAGVLEIGTYPQRAFLDRLIAEHRWTRHFGDDPERPELVEARRALKEFFIPQDPHWHDYARHRGLQAFEKIMEGLSRD